jgi:DeoR family fructose operon transcriptional repressor
VLVEDRRKQVLDLVKQRSFITLADLCRQVSTSESTVRRDLDFWDARGLIKRIHGGAMYLGDGAALPALEARASSQMAEKRRIARAAAARIRNGDAVLLDGGTTTLEVAKLLVGRPVQVVTNSLPIANLFANSDETDLVFLGGYVYPTTGVALGPQTIQAMQSVQVQQSILSVAGITPRGLFNSNPLLVETERQMMRCADEVVIVADHTKIGRQALALLCPLGEVDTLIVDNGITAEQRRLVEKAGPKLVIAGQTEEVAGKRRRS